MICDVFKFPEHRITFVMGQLADRLGEEMKNLKVEYQFFYDQKRTPRVTVCYLRFKGWTTVGLAINASCCNPNKQVGRAFAISRAKKMLFESLDLDYQLVNYAIERPQAEEALASTDLNQDHPDLDFGVLMYKGYSLYNPEFKLQRLPKPESQPR